MQQQKYKGMFIRVGKVKVGVNTLQTWIDALRSDKYDQIRTPMQNQFGYSALGLACALAIPATKRLYRGESRFLRGKLPSDQPGAPVWLKSIDEHFKLRNGKSITELNNLKSENFHTIASVLELVYMNGIYYHN